MQRLSLFIISLILSLAFVSPLHAYVRVRGVRNTREGASNSLPLWAE